MKTTKLLILFSFILAMASCIGACKEEVKPTHSTRDETISSEDEQLRIGITTREDLETKPYREWFSKYYDAYLIDSLTTDTLRPLVNDVSIKLFLGTWCEDSHREVPSFLKILDHLNFDEQRLTLISVDRDKKSDHGETYNMAIEFVPTFIFYRQQKEIGRIVEMPTKSLEKDLLALLE